MLISHKDGYHQLANVFHIQMINVLQSVTDCTSWQLRQQRFTVSIGTSGTFFGLLRRVPDIVQATTVAIEA
jgi:hypothetical protein